MTIESLLDEIEAILEEGKSIPFSSNLLVDASAIKTAIEDIRLNMPDELMQARKIASERKEILASAQENADKIIEKAKEKNGLTHREASVLLACEIPEKIEEIYALAREIKDEFYGNRIVMFAPLYLSNYCLSN